MSVNTPADQKALKGVISELVNSKYLQRAQAELQRDIIKEKAKELGIKPAMLRKLANIEFRQNYSKLIQESEEVQELYEKIYKPAE